MLDKLNKAMTAAQYKKAHSLRKNLQDDFSFRKLRTRTLIQLGGLIEKACLLETFGIALGDDLQRDEDLKIPVTELLGALVDVRESLENDQSSRTLFLMKGKEAFKEKAL